MNIVFIYNKGEIKFENKIKDLKRFIEENSNTYKIKILSKITNRQNCDLYVILSDDINDIYKHFDKIKSKERVLIITSNITAPHVIACINITNNITYLENSCEVILNRINKIYEKNK